MIREHVEQGCAWFVAVVCWALLAALHEFFRKVGRELEPE